MDSMELYNATGVKLFTIREILTNAERREKFRKTEANIPAAQKKVMDLNKELLPENLRFVRNHAIGRSKSAIHEACRCGDEVRLRREITEGTKVNARDSVVRLTIYLLAFVFILICQSGRTALQEAAASGHSYLIRILCREYNADLEVSTLLVHSNL